jgi:hypothetical protein
MRTLTEYQKNFILEHFFSNEDYKFTWKRIATALLDTGECLVSSDNSIWNGGIGNFIKTETPENAIGCLLYKFDLDYFLTSLWYKEIASLYLSELVDKKCKLEKEFAELSNTLTSE